MPVYERDGGYRVTVYANGRQHERRVRGPSADAFAAERMLRAELGASDAVGPDADLDADAGDVLWIGGHERSYVYFVQAGKHGPIKIGRTRNARLRLTHMQVGNHEKLFLRAIIPGGEQLERALHLAFDRHRIEGEWFRRCRQLDALVAELQLCVRARKLPGRKRKRSSGGPSGGSH